MDIIKAKEGLTVDERVDLINRATEDLNRGFFVISCEMRAIYTEMVKVDDNGKVSRKSQSEFFTFIEDNTGYKPTAVKQLLYARKAYENLSVAAATDNLPSNEWVIRPLATAVLNEDPERQAAIWSRIVEEADGATITASMVKKAVREELGKDKEPEEDKAEFVEATWGDGVEYGRERAFEDFLDESEKATLKSLLRKAAMDCHPDRGGSIEKMEALNLLREKLAKLL